MSKQNYSKLIIGEPIKCIVRIKQSNGPKKHDINIIGQSVTLVDANNRILDECEVKEVYDENYSLHQLFDHSIDEYVRKFIEGFQVSFFTFGSTGSGKTYSMEGYKQNPGIISLFANQLFYLIDEKYSHLKNHQMGNFNFIVRIRYLEILDEEITDLLMQNNQDSSLQVLLDQWEGSTVSNSTQQTVTTSRQLNEIFFQAKLRRNTSSNEFGNLSSQSSSFFQIELIQQLDGINKEDSVLISRANFFDLPSNKILNMDPDQIRVKYGNSMHKGILAFQNVIQDLSSNQDTLAYYEGSMITQLMRDCLGGNSYSAAIFNIQQGDSNGTIFTLKFLKRIRNIVTFPVVNDQRAVGLHKRYRQEILTSQTGKGRTGTLGEESYNMKMIELEKKLIEENLNKLNQKQSFDRIGHQLVDLREKYEILVKSKNDLQGELIQSEEEKLEVSKALVELQIENTKLLESIQNEKYQTNKQLLNSEANNLEKNLKEEIALKQVSEIQDRLKTVLQEQREMEIEFIALKKNYIENRNILDLENTKNEELNIELVNYINECKELRNQLNKLQRDNGNTSNENRNYLDKINELQNANFEFKQALILSKAENEKLKTEIIKYELYEKKTKIQLEQVKLDAQKGYLVENRNQIEEFDRLNQESEKLVKKINNDRDLQESARLELMHKIKLQERQIQDLSDKFNQGSQNYDELQTENTKLKIQVDEMKSIYRGKLLQILGEQTNAQDKRLGYDVNAKDELVQTYHQREIEILQELEQEKNSNRTLKSENESLKVYSKQLKYMAEDLVPYGQQLPELLTKPFPLNQNLNNHQFLEIELQQSKLKNRSLEEEIRQLRGQGGLQNRIFQEIETLKGNDEYMKRPQSSSRTVDQLRQERNSLQEENKKLVNLLKDNKKWDIFLLQKEIENQQHKIKQLHSQESVAPISGDNSRSLRQKIEFYEENQKKQEKERSELIIRSTMAEEQLKNLQEHLTKITQDYQKKIMDLKKQIKSYQ